MDWGKSWEVLIRQHDLLKKSVENVLKQISTLEEQGVSSKVSAAQRAGKLESHADGVQEVEVAHQQPSLENKWDEILKNKRTFQAAEVKNGGRRPSGKQKLGPNPISAGHITAVDIGHKEGLAADHRFSPKESERGHVPI